MTSASVSRLLSYSYWFSIGKNSWKQNSTKNTTMQSPKIRQLSGHEDQNTFFRSSGNFPDHPNTFQINLTHFPDHLDTLHNIWIFCITPGHFQNCLEIEPMMNMSQQLSRFAKTFRSALLMRWRFFPTLHKLSAGAKLDVQI